MNDYACPDCGTLRHSPIAACDHCPYDPDPEHDQDPEGANDPPRSIADRISTYVFTLFAWCVIVFLIVIGCVGLVENPDHVDQAITTITGRTP